MINDTPESQTGIVVLQNDTLFGEPIQIVALRMWILNGINFALLS